MEYLQTFEKKVLSLSKQEEDELKKQIKKYNANSINHLKKIESYIKELKKESQKLNLSYDSLMDIAFKYVTLNGELKSLSDKYKS